MLAKKKKRNSELWGIILAGGDGTRMGLPTRRIFGDERPKQFCPLMGDDTLVSQTGKRPALKIAPEKTLFVVTRKHEPFYMECLSEIPRERMVVQPDNKETGAALLDDIYRRIPEIDFSREIPKKKPLALSVMRVKDTGWNDLGQPVRLHRTLNKLDYTPQWTAMAPGRFSNIINFGGMKR